MAACNGVAVRRSALEFTPQLVAGGAEPARYATVLHDIAIKAEKVDSSENRPFGAFSYNNYKGPEGMPVEHWWWYRDKQCSKS